MRLVASHPTDSDAPVAWWLPQHSEPAPDEAAARLSFLREHGPSPYAFPPNEPGQQLFIGRVGLDDVDVQLLIAQLNADLYARYPEPGALVFSLTPADLVGDVGGLVMGTFNGRPVACGAFRMMDAQPGTAEIKRMYVAPSARGHKIGAAVLDTLERAAIALGVRRFVLEGGPRQPEALHRFRRAGYRECAPWGAFIDKSFSICMDKHVRTMRVVSLLPSATEIAIALGLSEQLVGVTFECDHPADPRVGRAVVVGGLDTHGLAPGEIDALVRAKVAAGEDMYTLDTERFRDLDPDVVLTQDLCRVCALPSGDVKEAITSLGCHAEVVTLDPHSLDDIFADILAVGRSTGVTAGAEALVGSLRARLAEVATAVQPASTEVRPRPRVFVLEWPDPPFVAGHWVPDLVEAAGGEAVLARPGQRSLPTTWDDIVAADPDVVVVASCGFDVAGTAAHAAEIMNQLPLHTAVWAIDANGLMVRPGPRVVDGVETLAAILHGIAPVAADRATLVRPGR